MSVNLPRIALRLTETDLENRKNKYMYELDAMCELAHKGLQTRLKRLKTVQAKQAPICWQYGALLRLQPDDYNARPSDCLGRLCLSGNIPVYPASV